MLSFITKWHTFYRSPYTFANTDKISNLLRPWRYWMIIKHSISLPLLIVQITLYTCDTLLLKTLYDSWNFSILHRCPVCATWRYSLLCLLPIIGSRRTLFFSHSSSHVILCSWKLFITDKTFPLLHISLVCATWRYSPFYHLPIIGPRRTLFFFHSSSHLILLHLVSALKIVYFF